jgi:hypothetical protein
MTVAILVVSMLAPTLFLPKHTEPRTSTRAELSGRTGLATLHALDPLSRTLCLRDGEPGGLFQDNEVKNRCSDIDFNTYTFGSFTVGIEGGRQGNIIDLGTAYNLKMKYGYQETVGNGQGFASLRIENGKIVILKDHKTGAVQELEEGRGLQNAGRAATVKLGHIYLVRLTDRHEKTFNLIAKLIVVDYRPNESVTVRWQLF